MIFKVIGNLPWNYTPGSVIPPPSPSVSVVAGGGVLIAHAYSIWYFYVYLLTKFYGVNNKPFQENFLWTNICCWINLYIIIIVF